MKIVGALISLAFLYFICSLPSFLLAWAAFKGLSGLRLKKLTAQTLWIATCLVLFVPGIIPTDFFFVPGPMIYAAVASLDLKMADFIAYQERYWALPVGGGVLVLLLSLHASRKLFEAGSDGQHQSHL